MMGGTYSRIASDIYKTGTLKVAAPADYYQKKQDTGISVMINNHRQSAAR
jgi:hypothetical protein